MVKLKYWLTLALAIALGTVLIRTIVENRDTDRRLGNYQAWFAHREEERLLWNKQYDLLKKFLIPPRPIYDWRKSNG